jgi:hypothetical protein
LQPPRHQASRSLISTCFRVMTVVAVALAFLVLLMKRSVAER